MNDKITEQTRQKHQNYALELCDLDLGATAMGVGRDTSSSDGEKLW